MRDEIIGGWRKPHNEELHNLSYSPNIIGMIKARRIRCAGHVARIGTKIIYTGSWWESQKERDQQEDLDIGGRIILKFVLEK
jgi:hypothetical protein